MITGLTLFTRLGELIDGSIRFQAIGAGASAQSQQGYGRDHRQQLQIETLVQTIVCTRRLQGTADQAAHGRDERP